MIFILVKIAQLLSSKERLSIYGMARYSAAVYGAVRQDRPRGYKTFFMLNSAENEICSASKKNEYQQFKLSPCTAELSMNFFLLIDIKMPTILV